MTQGLPDGDIFLCLCTVPSWNNACQHGEDEEVLELQSHEPGTGLEDPPSGQGFGCCEDCVDGAVRRSEKRIEPKGLAFFLTKQTTLTPGVTKVLHNLEK